jgi:hypothetical protein
MSRITKLLLATVLALVGVALFLYLRPEPHRAPDAGGVARQAPPPETSGQPAPHATYRELVPRAINRGPSAPGQVLPEPPAAVVALLQAKEPAEAEVLIAYKQDNCFCKSKDCIIDVEDRYRDAFARLKPEPDRAFINQLKKETVACKDRAMSSGEAKMTEVELVRRRDLEMAAAIPPPSSADPAPAQEEEPEQP